MLTVYLPEAIYERLPNVYLALAALLFVTPIGAAKWLAVAMLVVAAAVIKHWRRAYREAARIRWSLETMAKYRWRKDSTSPEPKDEVSVFQIP